MRLARLYAPGLPHLVEIRFLPHVASRWAQDLARAPFDRLVDWLGDYARAEGVRVHAWSLDPAALRLLATPAHRQALPRTIQALGRRLSGQIGGGSAYAGRYRSALVEPGGWVLPCQVWIETAPLREGWVLDATAWRWSSAGFHAGLSGGAWPWMHSHHDYWACGNTPFDRQATYRQRLMQGVGHSERASIEAAVKGQWALGSPTFVLGLQNVASRRVAPGRRGRPRKTPPAD